MARTRTDPTIPSEADVVLAREALRVLNLKAADKETLRVQMMAAGREVASMELPVAVAKLLKEVLEEMAAKRAVSVVPTETELTTQQAADLLNVSRPYLVGLVEKGTLPFRMVGNQRRLPLEAVLAYKVETSAKAREALREMAEIDQTLGLR